MLGLAWLLYGNLYTRLIEPWRWMTLGFVGTAVVGFALLMLVLRSSAHIQLFRDHLRVATPFLRLNVSYRRIQRVNTAPLATLFPPRSLRGLKRDILEPLFSQTAVVVELGALPLPPKTLRLFLSPFFFKDRSPHLVILVKDWMGFTTELESLRSGTFVTETVHRRISTAADSQLPRKK